MDHFAYEKELATQRGWTTFCGVDEAGRGPLAGPVCAAAVVLGEERIEGLDDSKKLTEKRRDKLFDEIISKCAAYSIKIVTVEEIEATDILSATMKAMREAIGEVKAAVQPDGALVDGDRQRNFPLPAMCVVGGDAKCASIAAASILAKVTRDRMMVEYDAQYPGYGFAKHKGYGTKAHFEAIDTLGLSSIHRASFLTKHLAKRQPKKQSRGDMGEDIALDFLQKKGYILLERQARSRWGEIDLIMQKSDEIVFVEVKLRDNPRFGEAKEFVDARKQHKLRVTAELWLQRHRSDAKARFDVVEIYPPRSAYDKEEIDHIENAF